MLSYETQIHAPDRVFHQFGKRLRPATSVIHQHQADTLEL